MLDRELAKVDYEKLVAEGYKMSEVLRTLVALHEDMTLPEWLVFATKELGVHKGSAGNRYRESRAISAELDCAFAAAN